MTSATELLRKYAADGATPSTANPQPEIIPFPTVRMADGHEATREDWDAFVKSKGGDYQGLTWDKMTNTLARARAGVSAEDLIAENRGGPRSTRIQEAPQADPWWRADVWFNPLGRRDNTGKEMAKGRPRDLSPWEKVIYNTATMGRARAIGRSADEREQGAIEGINTARGALNGLTMGASDVVYGGLRLAGVDTSGFGGDSMRDLRQQFIDSARRQGKSEDEIASDLRDFEYNQRMAQLAGALLLTGSTGKLNLGKVSQGTGFGARVVNTAPAVVENLWNSGRVFYPISHLSGSLSQVAEEHGYGATAKVLSYVDKATHFIPGWKASSAGFKAFLFPAAYWTAKGAETAAEASAAAANAGKTTLEIGKEKVVDGVKGAVDTVTSKDKMVQFLKSAPKASYDYLKNLVKSDLQAAPGQIIATNIENATNGEQMEVLPNAGVIIGSGARAFSEEARKGSSWFNLYNDDYHAGAEMVNTGEKYLTEHRDELAKLLEIRGMSADDAQRTAESLPAGSRAITEASEYMQSELAYGTVMRDAVLSVDQNVDFDSMSQEQLDAFWAEHGGIEGMAKACMPAMMIRAADGGLLPDKLLSQLSNEQLAQLATTCVTASVARSAAPNTADRDKQGFLDPARRMFGIGVNFLATGKEGMLSTATAEDPVLRAQLRPIMAYSVKSSLLSGSPPDEKSRKLYNAYFDSLPADEQQRATDMILDGVTPEQLKVMQQNSATVGQQSLAFNTAMNKSIGAKLSDKGFMREFCGNYAELVADGTGCTSEDIEKNLRRLEHTDFSKMEKEDLYTFVRYTLAATGSGVELSEPMQRKKGELTARVQDELMSRLREHPFEYMPMMASLFAAKMGYGKVADWLNEPMAFYGSALLLVGGMFWLGAAAFGGGEDDDDEPDAMGLMRRRKHRAEQPEELGTGYLVQ